MTDDSPPRPARGHPVVLTADRTLIAGYRTLFDGMVSASQTTRTPGFLMRWLIAPRVAAAGGHALTAPLGVRRVEASLLAGGRDAADVAVVPPQGLRHVIGPDTRLIGVSSGDPLGLGMNSTTMTAIMGGEIYASRWFRSLMDVVCDLKRRAPGAHVVVGGPGAWQLALDDAARRALHVDHVVVGSCEGNVSELFRRIGAGEDLPAVLEGRGALAGEIPTIRGAALMGAVEISRGCGLGCDFCTIAGLPMMHLPAETVLADVETNLTAGERCPVLVSEDVFRYGAEGLEVRPEAFIGLLERMRALPGLQMIQADHANIASVARFSDGELRRVRRLLAGRDDPGDYVWVNLGVESASGRLLTDNGCRAKMQPGGPDEWGRVCMEQVRRLESAGFFPLISVILGLPGERPDDLECTERWVEQLRHDRVAIFPMFYAPVDGRPGPSDDGRISRRHWRLVRRCYRLNFKWVLRLIWNNQSRAGTALWRRLLIQAFGRANVLGWRAVLAWRSRGVSA